MVHRKGQVVKRSYLLKYDTGGKNEWHAQEEIPIKHLLAERERKSKLSGGPKKKLKMVTSLCLFFALLGNKLMFYLIVSTSQDFPWLFFWYREREREEREEREREREREKQRKKKERKREKRREEREIAWEDGHHAAEREIAWEMDTPTVTTTPRER